ncbi:FAD-linked oxidase C-terminal domain-containing protein [Kribbella yunnanensis]|uniref:FAD-linked oxidase C-terminal domain-containing protein n=1 Tax=Kribbella yunnanensis TaxID=190194 RepID=A0ABN2IVE5_9ACTN
MNGELMIGDLLAALPEGRVVLDPVVVSGVSHDEAEWAPVGTAAAVVRPRSTEEVRRTVEVCLKHGAPVVPRGAGTGLSGGANAVDACVVLSLEKMASVLEINPLERLAVIQPGVINDVLRSAVAEHGLWYPPDPASSPWSTIGGNIATNAGGLCCVKYGVTRDYVLELEVVTGTAKVVRLGRRTAKGVAGYDLAGLIVGSEGTLGIVTEATVRLRPLPAPSITVVGYFSDVVSAGEAVRGAGAAGIIPAVFELVDWHCLRAVDEWKNMGLSVEAEVVLLARIDDPGATGEMAADQLVACFGAAGATWADRSTDPDEADALFAARRLAYPAVERLGPVLTEDVCVPRGQIPVMLARVEEIGRRHRVTIANIAHVGDGNLHPLLITEAGDSAARRRAQAAFEEILDAALELGGTITGEHGVGLLKAGGLERELSPEVLAMHRAVKAALDPAGLLNPGKVFARTTVSGGTQGLSG